MDKSEGSGGAATRALTDRERELLAFEKTRWNHAGAKESAIRELFGCSASLYYQALNMLIDKPAAYEAEPVLVKRLRRLRAERQRRRTDPRSRSNAG